jgi:hypothetical protein
MKDTSFRSIILITITLLTAVLYGHTLAFPFVFDDNHYLVNNPLIKDARYFLQLFNLREFALTDNRLRIDPDLTTNFMLRPITYLTFAANYWLNGLYPFGYRLVNITLHAANAMLLFRCVSWLFVIARTSHPLTTFSTRFIAAGTALLFLVHPLQTQSVTYVVQRFTTLATLAFLLTIYLYLRYRAADSAGRRHLFRGLSLLALSCGMLTKELLVTAPCVLFLLELVMFRATLATAGRRTWPHLLCLPVIPALVLLTSSAQQTGGLINMVNYSHYAPFSYLTTQFSVITTYLRMLLIPVGQNIDPDYPLYTSLQQIRPLLSLILLAGLGTLAVVQFRRWRDDPRSALLLFGASWFFLTIAVDSSVVPLPDLMAEQRIYLPSLGLFLMLTTLADRTRTCLATPRRQTMVVACLTLWGVLLGGTTVARNRAWHSEISIWQDATRKSPQKPRPWNALGIAYAKQERYGEAIPCFKKTCTLLLGQERYGSAIEACMKGLTLDPTDGELYTLMGTAYWELGQLEDAEQVLQQAIGIKPEDGRTRLTLARVLAAQEQEPAAREQLQAALRYAGDNPSLLAEIRRFAADLAAESNEQGQPPRP